MANIVTPDFRVRNITSFYDDLLSENYYTFVSSMEETDTFNSEYSKREFLEKTLFGKAVTSNDIYYMVKNTRYTRGVVYDAYDDKEDLSNKNFFVTVYPEDELTGNYYVFKCLSNNYGAPATDDLFYNPSIPNQTYITADDGYTWKYMYTITNSQFRTLATNNLIPIIEEPPTIFEYTFDTSTAAADPGSGQLSFNNADISLATKLYINSAPTGVQEFLSTMDTSNNDIKGYFRITNVNDKSEFVSFFITEITEETGYFDIDCEFMNGKTTSFASNTDLTVSFTLTPESIDGIESILITNPEESFGYSVLDGKVSQNPEVIGDFIGTIVIESLDGATVSQSEGYYDGQYILITKTVGDEAKTELYTVSNWISTGQRTGTLQLEENVLAAGSIIDDTCIIKIIPRIEILGNGTGAKAIPLVNKVNGSITGIQVLEPGVGYTNAVARVVDPIVDFNTTGINANAARCLIRPIISPPNGHNYNRKEELLSRHILINTEISETDNTIIPTSRGYTKLGLVKNPEFTSPENTFDNRLRVGLGSVEGINEDDILFQLDSTPGSTVRTFEGKVHSIVGTDVYFTDYNGPYINTANSDISLDTNKVLQNVLGDSYTIATNNLSLKDVTQSPYIQRTGEVFYINTFSPIERTAFSLEQYKILLQF